MLYRIVVLCSFIGLGHLTQECNLPPELWCSSIESAKRCKVYEQCKEYNTLKINAPKVNVTLYHESLCPDCINFITGVLWSAFTKVSDIFTLTMVPFGNAREYKDDLKKEYKFTCQHGKEECVGNIMETCAIYIMKNERQSFNYSHCIADYLKKESSRDFEKYAEKCANEQNVDFSKIQTCASGPLGNQLEHQMALMTGELNPKHTYVPWVTINGVHTEELQQKCETNLIKVICDTYQGTKPSACNEYTSQNRCYR